VLGAFLTGSISVGVGAPIVASAAPVVCNPASLVTALAAVSGSGKSGTVTLTAGCTYTMTAVNDTTDGSNAFPDVLGNVTVVGNGATITRSGATDFRFFIVDDVGSLNLSNVTLSNGSIPSGDIHGGAAILNRSLLTVTGVTFLNNHSLGSTGGGAIDNHDKGELTITGSTFTSNSGLQGGAIEDEATLCHTTTEVCGHATVTNSTFTNNSTTEFGGGAFEGQLDNAGPGIPPVCSPYPWLVTPCQEAGGAHDTLVGNTFSGNSAVTEGGAIASFGTMSLSNSTVYNNSAGSGGGGGVQDTGTITIVQSTIAHNTSQFGANLHSVMDPSHQPGVIALSMSIVTDGVTGANCSVAIPVTDNGYNLDSATSCGFTNNALNSTNPMLGPLASNGGPTQTMALQSGSPAINAIPSGFAGCSGSTDQRGVSRPQGVGCDIGAFEVYTTPPTVPTGLAATTTTKPSVTLTWNASTGILGVASYTIFRDGTKLASVSGTTLTYTDNAVAELTNYMYTVDAIDPAGNQSAQSTPPLSVTTPDSTPPTVPTNLTAIFNQNNPEVDLDWNASTDNVAVTGYTINRNGAPLITVSGSTLTYIDKAIVIPANYTYTVGAFDAAGNHSALSTPATVGTVDTVPPSVPTGLAAALNATHGVNLTWNASTDNVGVTGYQIWRGGVVLTTVNGSTLAYTDNAVSGLTTYTYNIDAFDAASNHSAQSAPAQITTGVAAPCQVPNVVASPVSPSTSGTQITITATTSGCPDPLYEFWMLPQGGSSWLLIQSYSSNPSFHWNSTGAAPGTEHFGVWVRDATSSGTTCSSFGCNDAVASIPYTMGTTGCTSVSLLAAPASPSTSGTQVSVMGTALGCPNPLYEFWMLAQGASSWQLVRSYSTSATWQWNTTGAPAGTELFGVWARDASSPGVTCSSFGCNDTVASILYTVTTTSCASVTMSASPVSPSAHGTGVQVTFTAVASGCANALYEFWMLPAGSNTWIKVQGYSTSATFTWNTNGAPAGTERFGVWVRDASSPGINHSSLGINDAVFSTLYTLT
jgi:predicted outer membrane repeat protein